MEVCSVSFTPISMLDLRPKLWWIQLYSFVDCTKQTILWDCCGDKYGMTLQFFQSFRLTAIFSRHGIINIWADHFFIEYLMHSRNPDENSNWNSVIISSYIDCHTLSNYWIEKHICVHRVFVLYLKGDYTRYILPHRAYPLPIHTHMAVLEHECRWG